MSLATRCTECHTTFKVVQDQLKVSRGWVRCGHCQQVFNALENMFDIDAPSAQPDVPTAPPEPQPEPTQAAPVPTHPVAAPTQTPPPPAAPPISTPRTTAPRQAVETSINLDFPDVPARTELIPPAQTRAEQPEKTEKPSSQPSAIHIEAEAVTQPPDHPSTTPSVFEEAETLRWANLMAPPSEAPPLERSLPPPSQRRGRSGTRGRLPPPVEPNFLKQAERQAIWRHPAIKGVLALLLLILLLLLAGQVLLHWRNDIAARAPATKPLLAQLCVPLNCTLTAPKNLAHLQVESVTVVKADSRGPDAYQLTVLVRNSSDSNVQWPLLDLTLTDFNGQTLTRRDLSVRSAKQVPADDNHGKPAKQFWPVPVAVEPGLIALQWQLQAPNMKLTGYTAELFYP